MRDPKPPVAADRQDDRLQAGESVATESPAVPSFHLTFDAVQAEITPAANTLRRFLTSRELSAKAVYGIELAFEELVTNIVKYAYDTPGTITIDVKIDPATVRITVSDTGRPFDPTSRETPSTADGIGSVPIGGLGLQLVRNIAQEMRYEGSHGVNRIEVSIAR